MRYRLTVAAHTGLIAFVLAGCAATTEQVVGDTRLVAATGAQPGDEALIEGKVALTEGGCVGLRTADGVTHLVIWPAGTNLDDIQPLRVELPSGAEVTIDEPVAGAGGFYEAPEELRSLIDVCHAHDEIIRIRFG